MEGVQVEGSSSRIADRPREPTAAGRHVMRGGSTFVSSVAMLAVASAVGLTGGIQAQDEAGRT